MPIADEPTQNLHVAFSGDDGDVRRFHADASRAGYRSNGKPGERSRYHPGYYAAYVMDPYGNNIEVVNHHHRPQFKPDNPDLRLTQDRAQVRSA